MAWARRSLLNASTTIAIEAGTSNAAPRACSTRPATRSSRLPAIAHHTDASVNRAIPPAYARRRPIRSVSRPQTTRKAANTML